jgi:hypothetical protein
MWPLYTIDPPLEAWDRLYAVFQSYADVNGIDLFMGRRVPRLLRDHGLKDIRSNAITRVHPLGHGMRMVGVDIIENLGTRFIEHDLIDADELVTLKAELRRHLEDPDTFVISSLMVQAWGRKPR